MRRFLLRWRKGAGRAAGGWETLTATVRVDDRDAHHLRDNAFRVHSGYVVDSKGRRLSQHILPGARVRYADGDPLNLQRHNLVACDV